MGDYQVAQWKVKREIKMKRVEDKEIRGNQKIVLIETVCRK